ncbi:hypothetical protein BZA77DRAFT_350589 [Pyronema omphalodes]|nr:hypothetical protein BZA77DRAFT_350589 [Pyronema omphalodes]
MDYPDLAIPSIENDLGLDGKNKTPALNAWSNGNGNPSGAGPTKVRSSASSDMEAATSNAKDKGKKFTEAPGSWLIGDAAMDMLLWMYGRMHFLTYEPTNLRTYKPTNLQTYKPTNLQTYKPTNLRTYEPTNLRTYEPTNLRTYGSRRKERYTAT